MAFFAREVEFGEFSVDPGGDAGEEEAEEEAGEGVVVCLVSEDPEEPYYGCEEGEGHDLLEGFHPGAGFRQEF